jgi:hypothetical protein
MRIVSRFFGSVDIDPEEGAYVVASIKLNQRMAECSLFLNKNIPSDPSIGQKCSEILDDLERLDRYARLAIGDAFLAGSATVVNFIQFHLEEVAEPIREKFGGEEVEPSCLIERLEFCGVSMHYDEDLGLHIVCDYSVGRDVSDEVLAVTFNGNRQILRIAHES